MADNVKITVDGREVDARPGEMIIAAAERAGTYIPRFCYHPRMKPVGMCRMCLVEVVGPRGPQLQPACFVPVAEGQVVVTDSAAVKKAQDGMLEFLLVNHPLDCPVCDKGGECPLQDQTFAFGPGETRFVEEKRHWAKPIPLSDLVLLDRERCIQCARCTRFADEIAGDAQITFVNRGEHTEVGIAEGKPFTSYFSGNTVQICPVGALTALPYRFKARPWDLEQVETTCQTCAVGCRMAVQSSANKITRYLGLDSDPVNQGWLCDKGRFAYEAVNDTAGRITSPLVRSGDDLVPVSWSEALAAVTRGLSDVRDVHGASALGVIGGARLANEDAYAWTKLAKSVLGTDSVDAQLGDGLPADVVLGLPQATIDDACSASALIIVAGDLEEELPVLYLRLRAAAIDRGLPIVEVTPSRSGLSSLAAATLTYRPGEVAAVASALVASTAPTAEVGGVSAEQLAAARSAVMAEPGRVVVVLGRPSVAEPAAAVVDAASALHAALPGATFLPALRRGNVRGALDMGMAPGLLPGRVGLDAARPWFTQAWGRVPESTGVDTLSMLGAAAGGRLQGLVLLGSDPLSDVPDRQLARRGLSGAGFVVAVTSHLNESARAADVVLPAATFAERPGSTTNIEGRVTKLGQKVVAPELAWPDWMIAVELAAALGADLGFTTLDDITDEIARVAPSHAGLTAQVLGDRARRDGVLAGQSSVDAGGSVETDNVIDPTAEPATVAVEAQGVDSSPEPPTDDGTQDDGAVEAEVSVPRLSPPPLIGFTAPSSRAPEPAADSYSLRLVAQRRLYDAGVAVQRTPWLAGLGDPLVLRVHPSALDRLGLGSGGKVRVSSPRGAFVVDAVGDPGVPRGAAVLPFNSVGDGAADLLDAALPATDVRIETV